VLRLSWPYQALPHSPVCAPQESHKSGFQAAVPTETHGQSGIVRHKTAQPMGYCYQYKK